MEIVDSELAGDNWNCFAGNVNSAGLAEKNTGRFKNVLFLNCIKLLYLNMFYFNSVLLLFH